MVRAIEQAGGRPVYQEFSGIDHNETDTRAYSLPDLYEWLLLQNRVLTDDRVSGRVRTFRNADQDCKD